MPDDASATFRGFRHQALYVLARLLTDEKATEWIYRPEGSEDLAVYDENLNLIEAVQVKDHTSALTLSKLKSAFWERFHLRRSDWPKSTTKLATFGDIGPELSGALEGNKDDRAKVIAKMCEGSSYSRTDAECMLNELQENILRPSSKNLQEAVHHAIRHTNVGGDVESAADLLMYWIFEASERRRALTRKDMLLQLQRIGTYLAALRDSSAEWGNSIQPVTTPEMSQEELSRLIAEYRTGVQARWEHIVAGADCERIERLTEIHRKFSDFPVVIIRGASGQGKSTLGWRYLRDFVPDGMRFHIRRVEGREHAFKIANALGDHVRTLKLKAVVYVDIAPSDAGWSDLIAELASAGLKALVAVREEDFRRANLSGADFYFSELLLDRLTREEAKPIFAELHRPGVGGILDFDEAWARFTAEEGGPLLEFTHLVTQGELLQTRIRSQVTRIQGDAVAGNHGLTQRHMEILALAAVANETGARVSLGGLCEQVGLSPISLPLHVLESEYLLRLDTEEGDSSVAPLHILRSKALVNVLFADVPAAWIDYARRILPYILDTDIEPFLLAAFSRHPEHSGALLSAIATVPLRSWTHAAGIAAALLWEGASRYEMRNREAILAAIAKYDVAWWWTCDSLIGSDKDAAEELHSAVQELAHGNMKTITLTPKVEVLELFLDWASATIPPIAPKTSSDWRGAGDIAHWIGRGQRSGKLRESLESCLPDDFPPELDIETIASYISGRVQFSDTAFETWHRAITPVLATRFLRDTASEYLANDGRNITVYFSTPLADVACRHDPKASDWHWQTMKRVRLMQMLFPGRETYGSQGLGLSPLQLGHDPTFKRIPAKSTNNERATHLNAMFLAIVAFRHQRVDSWKEYSDAALKYRQAVSDCFRKLHRGWAKLLSANPPPASAYKELPGAELDALKPLSKLPMFPRSAVDEWGFVSEGRSEAPANSNQRLTDLLRRFGKWRKAFGEFESGVELFVSHIMPATIIFTAEHKNYSATEEDEKTTRLMVFNLAAAWNVIPQMQSEFRRRFGHLYSKPMLDELDRHERSNFRHLWPVAFAMHCERKVRIPGIGSIKEREISQMREAFLRQLRRELENLLGKGAVTIGDKPWFQDGEPHLLVICNHRSISSLAEHTEGVVHAIWRGCHFKQWRNMEWHPLVIEWPQIAVVHVLNGKALQSACVRLNTMVFCATGESLEVQQHHLVAVPVNSTDFATSGIPLWDNPLMERVIQLQGAITAFCFTVPRFFELLSVAQEQNLQDAELERVLPRYSKELDLVWREAQSQLELTLNALSICGFPEAAIWHEALRDICTNLLFTVGPEQSLSLTPDDFFAWSENFVHSLSRFHQLTGEMLSVVLK